MGHDCRQSIRRVVRAHSDEADIEVALDLVRKNDGDSYVEGAIRYVYLQSRLANSGYVLLVNVNEGHIVASAGKSASDDSTDGSSADDDYARAHGKLLGDSARASPSYWKRAVPSIEMVLNLNGV
jgi:hypothetical protein